MIIYSIHTKTHYYIIFIVCYELLQNLRYLKSIWQNLCRNFYFQLLVDLLFPIPKNTEITINVLIFKVIS